MAFFISFLLFALVIVGIGMVYFNKIVKLKVRVNESWSDINLQLKRRHNLIGNLVNTVKGYATHESGTLEKVIQARTAAKQAITGGLGLGEIQKAEKNLSTAFGGLNINALTESYPELKANESFNNLMSELTDTEDKIAASRRFYNTTVLSLNTAIQQFPGMLFASMANAKKTEFFELDENEAEQVKQAPKVDFNLTKPTPPTPSTPKATPEAPPATPASKPTAPVPAPTSEASHESPKPDTTPAPEASHESPKPDTTPAESSTPNSTTTDETAQ